MSHEGKMRRGEKWWIQRDNKGILPNGIKNDPEKMKDVDYFLENKPPEPPVVEKKKEKGGK